MVRKLASWLSRLAASVGSADRACTTARGRKDDPQASLATTKTQRACLLGGRLRPANVTAVYARMLTGWQQELTQQTAVGRLCNGEELVISAGQEVLLACQRLHVVLGPADAGRGRAAGAWERGACAVPSGPCRTMRVPTSRIQGRHANRQVCFPPSNLKSGTLHSLRQGAPCWKVHSCSAWPSVWSEGATGCVVYETRWPPSRVNPSSTTPAGRAGTHVLVYRRRQLG